MSVNLQRYDEFSGAASTLHPGKASLYRAPAQAARIRDHASGIASVTTVPFSSVC